MTNQLKKPTSDSINCDLHTHTTASDGSLSPTELIDLAISNDTEMLAITDHDTIDGYLSVRNTATTLQLISGVEVSTIWSNQGVHIVGLNFDPEHTEITQLLSAQKQARKDRCQIIIDRLAKSNMPLTLDDIHKNAGHKHIGRPHIAQAMINKGYVANMDKAFKKFLGAGKIGDVKSGWASLEQTISAITISGGIAVIAHPDKYKMTRMKNLRFIDEFIEMGGQGIEVISSRQHQDVTEKYTRIANEKEMYASIGSDFHRHSYTPCAGKMPLLPNHCNPIWKAFK